MSSSVETNLSNTTVEGYWRYWRIKVEQELVRLTASGEPKALWDSIRYSVNVGGKRLRPVLLLAAVDALGGDPRRALPAACALELVHTFSLIHDDLPALDNDGWRRGVPSNHIVHGEATAILAGDTLHALAFQVLSRDLPRTCSAKICLGVMRELADAAVHGLAAGQMADLNSSSQHATTSELREIHAQKTGSMFRCAVRMAALLAKAPPARAADLDRYASFLGLAFQIADDIIDATGTREQLGKSPGKDARDGKATYVTVHGLADAHGRLAETGQRAIDSLSAWGDEAAALRALANYVLGQAGPAPAPQTHSAQSRLMAAGCP